VKSNLADAWVWPFIWQGSPSLFTAMFKAVEDRINAKVDTEYGVQLLLVVEDSVKFYSSFLPLLYAELWKQNKSLETETMHTRERLLRMHSRPKVMLCTNFDEALDIYQRYRENVLGVITDAGYPRGGIHDEEAGLKLAATVMADNPVLPVLMQSAQKDDSPLAHHAREIGCKFISKESPSMLSELRSFMHDDLFFGPLKFRDGITGQQLGSVSSVTEMMEVWEKLPLSSIAYHARHAHLSKWFFAKASIERHFAAFTFAGWQLTGSWRTWRFKQFKSIRWCHQAGSADTADERHCDRRF